MSEHTNEPIDDATTLSDATHAQPPAKPSLPSRPSHSIPTKAAKPASSSFDRNETGTRSATVGADMDATRIGSMNDADATRLGSVLDPDATRIGSASLPVHTGAAPATGASAGTAHPGSSSTPGTGQFPAVPAKSDPARHGFGAPAVYGTPAASGTAHQAASTPKPGMPAAPADDRTTVSIPERTGATVTTGTTGISRTPDHQQAPAFHTPEGTGPSYRPASVSPSQTNAPQSPSASGYGTPAVAASSPAYAAPAGAQGSPASVTPVSPAASSAASFGAGLVPEPSTDVAFFRDAFNTLVNNISAVVVGKERPIRQVVCALMVGGHILLEDNPGTGKTQLARALANSIDTSFKRIQFTPDLLPSDVVGVTFYDQKTGDFTFREGPVFASIVLADEINRASPKTQSALLEVMEEQKVTVDGVTHDVPQPFIVIATQNPIEQLGTYKLPEAQMDRFLIKTSIGYPGHDVSVGILKQLDVTDRAATVSPVLSGDDVLELRRTAQGIHVADAITEYIVRLVEETRHNDRIMVGASMRGALALTRCARIWAASDGRGYVVPDDVKDMAVPVLAHRITLTAEATFAGDTAQGLIERIVDQTPAPAIGI